MITKVDKEKLIKKFRIHDSDTGSSNIQVAILTKEIQLLTDHLKKHKKDYSSRRGLIGKINERRKLLRYLEKVDLESFEMLVKKLKIRLPKKVAKIKLSRRAKDRKEAEAAKREEAAKAQK